MGEFTFENRLIDTFDKKTVHAPRAIRSTKTALASCLLLTHQTSFRDAYPRSKIPTPTPRNRTNPQTLHSSNYTTLQPYNRTALQPNPPAFQPFSPATLHRYSPTILPVRTLTLQLPNPSNSQTCEHHTLHPSDSPILHPCHTGVPRPQKYADLPRPPLGPYA